MQSITIVVIACLLAVVVAQPRYEQYPAVDALHMSNDATIHESIHNTPVHDRSPRTKRGLLLLKKKLLLGALGLKAAKIGAVGAGVVGAFALKSKSQSVPKVIVHTDYGHAPSYKVHYHSWSG